MRLLRSEIPKALIGVVLSGTLSLGAFCFVKLFQSQQYLLTFGTQALIQEEEHSEQLKLLGEFVESSAPILERSSKRTEQLKGLANYKKADLLDDQARNSWHILSAAARLEATQDLASLSRFSNETLPLSTPVKDGLKDLLKTETGLWEKVDVYVDAKSNNTDKGSKEEEAFRSFLTAFLEHGRSIGAIQALYLQTIDSLVIVRRQMAVRHESQIAELDRTKRTFNLAFAGATTTLIAFLGLVLFIVYPHLKSVLRKVKSGRKKNKTC